MSEIPDEEWPATLDGDRVVAAARGWIGTPYRHQASLIGAGADCLGVVRGVWRELIGPEPEPLAPYARSWAEDGGAEMLLAAARRRLVELPPDAVTPGDVLLFRVRRDGPARHAGVATGPAAMVHAYDGHAVAETPIPDVWRRRLVARFRFPAA
ncbi:NlpC/P60 family putative phage cell wall peptidase [Methylopila capsulata]|uniref:Peptidase n=1 Tax=Methylopila capsulata TaxID=61654 RepID=A0A9W6MSH4_9HYPH|nr:NlpC/P60 family protein [Methylopila capsulata]MBM7852102.1 NlpC/P60 family putative phage cell wall peptidase [Methylopila capsulata]GLK56308.1 peptidase [Methylopila capsulata]